MKASAANAIRVNARDVDFSRGTVSDGAGLPVTLRPQSLAVLTLLAARPGELVSKDELMAAVWPGIAVTDDSLVQCITEIRKALGDDAHTIIKTAPKRGYVFEPGAPVAAPKIAAPSWKALAALIVAVLLAVIAGLQWFKQAPSAPGHVPAIAVLPFDNMSDDPKLTYFSDGVSDDIITMLARAPGLTVIARNSSFTYRSKPTDVRQVGKELNVGYVLEGSVRKDAGTVRIVAQLVDAKTGEHVWAERFDRTGADPWALQDEVTGKIIGALIGEKGMLMQAQYRETWGKDTANLQEYDYYLRGHELLMKFKPEATAEAGRIWTEGLAAFPNSSLLRIKLGFYHMFEVTFAWSGNPPEDRRRAGQLVREALAMKGLTPMEKKLAHWLFAYVHAFEGDINSAEKEAEVAVALSPYDAFLTGDCSQFHIYAGNYDSAIAWADFAIKNDPAFLAYYAIYKGWAETAAGRYAESRETMKDSGDFMVNAPLLRAINAVRLGLIEEAKLEIAKAELIIPGFTSERWREIAYASDPAVLDRQIADLVKAGLKEK